jgi:hypothetical protein
VAAALGGRELAAIAGAVLAARRHQIPVLLDGFVATASIVPLTRLDTGILDHCRAGHVSAESGHRALLRELRLNPLLDLNMRLGEASGAASPSCCCAPHLPAMPGWPHSPKPGFPAPTNDKILSHRLPLISSFSPSGLKEPLMMRTAIMKAIFLAVVLCALVSPPAQAEVRILASPGGQVGPFLDLFERVRASGERVVIDGPCLSACTLVLSVVPDDRICVTRRAILGFHAARSIDRRGRMYAEPEASELVLEAYPAPVRGWIRRRGGLTSHLLLLRGRELAAIYPSCR